MPPFTDKTTTGNEETGADEEVGILEHSSPPIDTNQKMQDGLTFLVFISVD